MQYKLILRDRTTQELCTYEGEIYKIEDRSNIVVAILNTDLSPAGHIKEVKIKDIEILDPQPYDD